MIGGIVWEILDRLSKVRGLAGSNERDLHVDSEMLKIVSDELCREASVDLRLHSLAAVSIIEGKKVGGAILESKSGRQAVLAKCCIDCTGDGDIAASAGAAFEMGTRRIGLNFKVGGVDFASCQTFEKEHAEKARSLYSELKEMGGFRIDPCITPHSDIGVYWINVPGLADRQGEESEQVPNANLEGKLSAISVEDLTFAEVELRRRFKLSLDFYRKRIPGYENIRLLSIASQLGVRESRRIEGHYRLTRSDVKEARQFDDGIGIVGTTMTDTGHYHVPYRSLVSRDIDSLLVAGRCICTDHWAQNLTRLIPAALMTGQAAGTAAALSIREKTTLSKIESAELRNTLYQAGVILA
jgi:hypothetical protein